jgi:iron(III) transport system permease protein
MSVEESVLRASPPRSPNGGASVLRVVSTRPGRSRQQDTTPAGALSVRSVSLAGVRTGYSSTIRSRRRPTAQILPWIGLLLALVVSIPVLTVLGSLTRPTDGLWLELLALTLPRYLANTVGLLGGVGVGVVLVGVSTAWLVTVCRFPGSRVFEWALILPMAMPAYLLAYTYGDLLQYPGPVQTALRGWFGLGRGAYWFPEIRSLGGAIVVMTAVLYPYVYLLARAAFLEQSVGALEASRTLGRGPWRSFLSVALPLARPSIVAGLALVMMEALADFGTVKHFEVDTFTTGIYLSWFGMGSPVGAAKLAAGLLLFVLIVIGFERLSRGRRRYHQTTTRYRPLTPFRLDGWKATAAIAVCTLPILVGFLVPGGRLLGLAVAAGDQRFGAAFVGLARNSLLLAVGASVVAAILALVVAYGVRLAPSRLMRLTAWVSTLGYTVPGSVIAVGVLLPFGALDNGVDAWMRATFGISTGLLLSGTIFALLFAYVVRFLALSFNSVESGLGRVTPSMDGAARTLGHGPLSVLGRIHLPLLRGSLLTGALLVFVDTLKELPATLIIRPFNFDTLAVRVYLLASDERLAEASTAALTIVVVGIVPVIVLSLAITRSRPGQKTI